MDQPVELGIGELLHAAAFRTDEVVVVAALGALVADTAIFEHEAADGARFLQQLHRAEDGRAPDGGSGGTELFDGERAAEAADGIEDGASRSRDPRPGLGEAGGGIRGDGNVSILGTPRQGCQRTATGAATIRQAMLTPSIRPR